MAGKRTQSFNPDQLLMSLGAPAPDGRDDALQGIERRVSSAVALIIKEDPRDRAVLAADMSAILGDTISKAMLDGYSAESRVTHNISFGRFLALIAESQRYDVLAALLREIGATAVVGDEVFALELGHLEIKLKQLARRRHTLKNLATGKGDVN